LSAAPDIGDYERIPDSAYEESDKPLPHAEGVSTATVPREEQVSRRPALNWEDIEGREPPAREWVIPHWLPAGHVTLLAGRGGIGKTLLAQHIGTAAALGRNYVEPLAARRVLMWAGEDDEAELWRRQIAISHHFGPPLTALTERFYLHSYAGSDITLMAPTFGQLQTTGMLTELIEQVRDYRAEFVILDNIARLFGGSENDRHQVTTFCALVHGACSPATVLLLGHPAKAQGSEFSGSTAWEGAVRARLYLSDQPPDMQEDDPDAPVDPAVRYLSRRKANYSPLDLRRFTLGNGVLVPDKPEPARAQGTVSGEFAKDIVRRAITKLAERGLHGSLSTASTAYLPKLAKQYDMLDRLTPPQFGKVMREMYMAEEITQAEIGKYTNRNPKMGLVLHK
jgi:RecA-family ATPase